MFLKLGNQYINLDEVKTILIDEDFMLFWLGEDNKVIYCPDTKIKIGANLLTQDKFNLLKDYLEDRLEGYRVF